MNKLLSILALVASAAFAQDSSLGPTSGGISRGNFLRIPDYRTPGTGAQTYFVDPTGSDTNTCQASGTNACLTIQGAINKIPKLLRDNTSVTIAAGTYTGFNLSGFYYDTGVQQTTGGLLINGTLANSTLATGSTSGTFTAGSAGSGATFGTGTDGASTWTVNDLRGRILTITGGTGSGQVRVISSNTTTVITVVGTWTAPTGTSTYVIQDSATIINTATTLPPAATGAANAAFAGIIVADNNLTYRAGAITFQNLRLTNTAGRGAVVNDSSGITFIQCQFINNATADFAIGSGTTFAGAPFVNFTTSYLFSAGTTVSLVASSLGSGFITATNSLFQNGLNGITTQGSQTSISFTSSETTGSSTAALNVGSRLQVTNSRLACASSAGVGILVGAVNGMQPGSVQTASTSDIETCGIGVQAVGAASAVVTTLSGSPATTGLDARQGGYVEYTTSTTIAGTTQDFNVENGLVTGTLASIVSGQCASSPGYGSRVCKQ